MLKLFVPVMMCFAVTAGTAKSMITNRPLMGDFELNNKSMTEVVGTKLSDLETCRTSEIPVYFYETYVTYHSSQSLNAAMKSAGGCNVDRVIVTLFDTPIGETPVSIVKTELAAFGDAHQLGGIMSYEVSKSKSSTETLNGLAAKIEFIMAVDSKMESST